MWHALLSHPHHKALKEALSYYRYMYLLKLLMDYVQLIIYGRVTVSLLLVPLQHITHPLS